MTVRNRSQLNSEADSAIPDQLLGEVSAADIRQRVKDLADSAVLPEDGLGMLGGAAALTVLGRSANSTGVRADIAAGSDDTLLRRTASALSFGQLTIGMLPDSILTYAKLAAAVIASAAEYRSAAASKLLSAAGVWSAAECAVLTDATTIVVDLNSGIHFGGASGAALGMAENRTLGNPSNAKDGQSGVLWFTAVTSTRTLTLGGSWIVLKDVETGPYSITTDQELGVVYIVRGTTVFVTAIIRKG